MAKQRKKKRATPRPQSSPGAAGKPAGGPSGSKPAGGKPAANKPPADPAPSRPVRAKPTRQERIEAAARQRRRRRLVRRGIGIGALVLVVGVIVTLVVADRRAEQRTISRMEAGTCNYDTRSDGDRGQGRNHVAAPTYEVDPPAGGDHLANAAAPGVYTDQVPPDGQLVHALEHGDIILWHTPEVPGEVVSQLRDLSNRYDRDVLVVPRASLTGEVAATAWHRRLLCSSFEQGPLDLFIRTYRDKGPEKVEE